MKAIKICAVVLVLACPLLADSISAYAVQGGRVYLGDPNLVLHPTFDSYLELGSTIPSGFEGQIAFTLSVLGQNYVKEYDLTFPALLIEFTFKIPTGITGPTPANLTVNFAGFPEHDYRFQLTAVPEPSAFVLFGTGLALVYATASAIGKRKKKHC